MYAENNPKFAEFRPIEIVPDMMTPEISDGRRQIDHDESYSRLDNYSSSFVDIWRESPTKPATSNDVMTRYYDPTSRNHDATSRSQEMAPRSPVGDYGYSSSLPLSSIELEPLSGVFSFSGYKDLTGFKDKGPNDSHMADALLSLKHAVVHPSQINGPLSPLSPTLTSLPSSGSSGMGQMGAFGYNGGAHGQGSGFGSGGGSGCGPGQFLDQMSPGTGVPGQYTQHGMFPSMSVNVSMSMNVGVPPNMQSCNFPEHAQWSNPYAHQHMASNPASHYSPAHGMTSQNQYPSYGATAPPQTYHTSYTLTDLRSPSFTTKDAIYRNTVDPYKPNVTRFYSLNPLSMRRSKMSGSRGSSMENAKVNLCRICGKTYARPSTLKTHMRTHSGEKPYCCSTCNKSFSQAANLTAHVRTHSGEKPFRCLVCERRFSQSSSVTTHMRTHSGERPYRCRMCKKAFSDSSTLTKHLRIHSGEKPYQCKLCLLRFSQSGNLNRHMRVHSNNS